jgi:hypothetical protein
MRATKHPVETDAIASQEIQMFKRMMLAVTFVAALSAASLGMSGSASAHGCGPGYAVGYYPSYGTYYYPGSAVTLRTAYYPPVYPVYFRGGFVGGHHYHHHNGITLTFGF